MEEPFSVIQVICITLNKGITIIWYVFCICTVTCKDLETPSNGSIDCSSNNQPLQYQDYCTFQCNDGYELQGSEVRQCEASGEWNGSRTQCNIRHCPNITTLIPNSRSCDTSYTSTCMMECEDGYIRLGDSPSIVVDLTVQMQYGCILVVE